LIGFESETSDATKRLLKMLEEEENVSFHIISGIRSFIACSLARGRKRGLIKAAAAG